MDQTETGCLLRRCGASSTARSAAFPGLPSGPTFPLFYCILLHTPLQGRKDNYADPACSSQMLELSQTRLNKELGNEGVRGPPGASHGLHRELSWTPRRPCPSLFSTLTQHPGTASGFLQKQPGKALTPPTPRGRSPSDRKSAPCSAIPPQDWNCPVSPTGRWGKWHHTQAAAAMPPWLPRHHQLPIYLLI